MGTPEKRDKAGRFVKGVSGNAGGRPKIPADVKEMLRAATVDAAKLLIDTMQDKGAKLELRIDCCKTIMDRVYGKATQPIEGNVQAAVRSITDEEAKKALEALGYVKPE